MIYLIIPAFNEEENLPALLKSIYQTMSSSKLDYKVIIINDGSNDNTLNICREFSNKLPIKVVNHTTNKGLAESIKDGYLEALKTANDEDIIVRMDGDNTFTPMQIPEMSEKINSGYEIIISSRYKPKAKIVGVPLLRRIYSRIGNLLLKIFIPIKNVNDYSCGFRAYKAHLIKSAIAVYRDRFVDKNGFSSTVTELIKIKNITPALKVTEIPVILRYDLKKGKSKIKILPTIAGYFKLLFKESIRMKIASILFFAFLLRLITAVVINLPLEPDSGHYNQIASDIISGKGFGDMITRPPGYSVFLAGIYSIFGSENYTAVKIIQAILSTLTVYIVFLLTKQIISEQTALFAAIICAIDPFQIFFSGKILSETTFIFLLILFIYLYDKALQENVIASPLKAGEAISLKNPWQFTFLSGIVLGITNLFRAVASGIFFFYIICGIIAGKYRTLSAFAKIFTIFVIMYLVLLPWILRNYFLFGRFITVSVQKGWNMYEGLNPEFDNPDAIKSWQDNMGEETKEMSILERDNYFWQKSINWIKKNLKEFIILSIRKFFKFWRLYPYGFAYSLKEQIISIAFFLPLIILSIYGMILLLRKWPTGCFFYLTILYFTLVSMIFANQIRYRIPVHPILAIFSGAGLNSLIRKWK